MEFSSFAQTLKPIIAEGASEDVFAQTLFINITKFSDEDENVVANTPLASYKSYYTGRRGLTKFAPKITKYLEPERFVAYIDEAGDAAQKDIFHELSPHNPGMTDWNVAESCAGMFKDIILGAAKRKRTPKNAKTGLIPADLGVSAMLPANSERRFEEVDHGDLYLLAECTMKCPVCGRKLVYEKKGKQFCRFQIVPIFPYWLENAERIPFEEKRKAPARLDSQDNLIMLCDDCAETYRTETTPDEYLQMSNTKNNLKNAYRLQQVIDTKDIEKEIEEVLFSLSSLKGLPAARKQKLDAHAVRDKIPDEEFMLREKVMGYVLKYYRYIEGLFVKMEREGKLRYKKVRNEVSDCFEALNQMNYSRSEIFDQMVQWLLEHTENQKREACEAVISFFVQNCEVFDEIAQ